MEYSKATYCGGENKTSIARHISLNVHCQYIPAEGYRQTVQAKAMSVKGDQYF